MKYVLTAFVFLSSNFYLSTYDDIVYNNVKLGNRLQFYSSDYISTCNELHETRLLSQFSIFTISKLKAINTNKSFYRLTLILSGDISSNLHLNRHPPNLKELVHGPGAQNWGDGAHSRSLSFVTISWKGTTWVTFWGMIVLLKCFRSGDMSLGCNPPLTVFF